MASTKYTYSISDDFPNQKVNSSKLTYQINESSIIIALDYIETVGDDCNIWFKDSLSSGDQTTLDTIVANHDGNPLVAEQPPAPVKIIENNLLDPETSLSATDGHHVTIKANQDVTEHSISYPYAIDVQAARYMIAADNSAVKDGDRFDIIGIPGGDPFVGYVTANTAEDETVIPVSATVFDYLRHGLSFKFASHSKIYKIISTNSSAGTLTLSEGLEQAITVGDYLYIRRYMSYNLKPIKGTLATIGDLQFSSAGLCANAQIIIRYQPESQPTEDFVLSFELIYSY